MQRSVDSYYFFLLNILYYIDYVLLMSSGSTIKIFGIINSFDWSLIRFNGLSPLFLFRFQLFFSFSIENGFHWLRNLHTDINCQFLCRKTRNKKKDSFWNNLKWNYYYWLLWCSFFLCFFKKFGDLFKHSVLIVRGIFYLFIK